MAVKGKVKVGLMFDSGGLEVDGSGLKVMQVSERAISSDLANVPLYQHWD